MAEYSAVEEEGSTSGISGNIVGRVQESDVLEGPDGINCTEFGNAERVLLAHREELARISGTTAQSAGTFYHFDGQRWQRDDAGRVRELVKATMRSLGQLVSHAAVIWPAKKVTELAGFWSRSEQEYMVRDVIAIMRSSVAVDRGLFDANRMLFGVQNGVIELETGLFRECLREDFSTKQANVEFNKTAECPLWLKFMKETTANDRELMRYLQQCAGICLTGEVEEHLFFIVLGRAGTGKTTFQETLKYVWGDYCCGIDPNSLAAAKIESARARPDLAKLPGMRLVFANESRAGLRLDEGLLKSLVGSDTITCRELYQAEFDFIPQFKLWLRTNERPVFDGADTGMQRRVRLVMFDEIVQHKDTQLLKKLRKEGSGILNWALAGLKDYQTNGLVESERVLAKTQEYIESLDIVKQFLTECCEQQPSYTQDSATVASAYRAWCDHEKIMPYGHKRFSAELETRGFVKEHTRTGKVWRGLKVRDDMNWAPSLGVRIG